MIIDHEARVVIATPTKCASKSLEAMVKRKVHADRSLEVVRPGQHRMDCPAQARGYRRLLLCRNPWSRIVSMWSYLRRMPLRPLNRRARVGQLRHLVDHGCHARMVDP